MKIREVCSVAVLTVLSFLARGQNTADHSESSYRLNVKINTGTELVHLMRYDGGKLKAIDSANVVNDKVEFSGKLSAPQVYYLQLDRSFKLPIFMEGSKIKVKIEGLSSDSSSVSGSGIHDQWTESMQVIQRLDTQFDTIRNRYYAAKSEGKNDRMEMFSQQYDSVEVAKDLALDSIILSNRNSYISPYLVVRYKMYGGDPDELEGYSDQFAESILNSPYIEVIDKRIEKLNLTKIGNQIPNFTLADSTGTLRSIEEFRGQYVLVDFWASWCGPCRRENPNIVKAYNEFKDNGFTVLGLSLDKERKAWLNAVEKDSLEWTQLSDLKGWDNEVARMFGVRSIPFSILIDPEGVIVAKDLTGEELHLELDRLLSK